MACSTLESQDVQTNVYFLAREARYAAEKPYVLRYNPGPEFPQTNIEMMQIDAKIRDLRKHQTSIDWEISGFQIMRASSALSYEDFDDRQKIINVHIPAISHHLAKALHARTVRIFDYNVSF